MVKIALENAKYGHLAQSPPRLFVSLNKDVDFSLKMRPSQKDSTLQKYKKLWTRTDLICYNKNSVPTTVVPPPTDFSKTKGCYII